MRLAVGFFDGLHLGHAKILAAADAVLTFVDHPTKVLAPTKVPPLIYTPSQRLAALRNFDGGRQVVALPFTPQLAAQSPQDFVAWLKGRFPDLEEVRCGANWTFGRNAAGNATTLRALGVQVQVVDYAVYAGRIISSTRIRQALAAGELQSALAMLGHPYTVEGTLAKGKGLGKQLGYPTLNLHLEGDDLLCRGVYAVETPYGRGIANYGTAPSLGTLAWQAPVLEVHIVQPQADLSQLSEGLKLKVNLLKFLRPERHFPTLEALKSQLALDLVDSD